MRGSRFFSLHNTVYHTVMSLSHKDFPPLGNTILSSRESKGPKGPWGKRIHQQYQQQKQYQDEQKRQRELSDIPEEILEPILLTVCFQNPAMVWVLMMVCRRWYRIVAGESFLEFRDMTTRFPLAFYSIKEQQLTNAWIDVENYHSRMEGSYLSDYRELGVPIPPSIQEQIESCNCLSEENLDEELDKIFGNVFPNVNTVADITRIYQEITSKESVFSDPNLTKSMRSRPCRCKTIVVNREETEMRRRGRNVPSHRRGERYLYVSLTKGERRCFDIYEESLYAIIFLRLMYRIICETGSRQCLLFVLSQVNNPDIVYPDNVYGLGNLFRNSTVMFAANWWNRITFA